MVANPTRELEQASEGTASANDAAVLRRAGDGGDPRLVDL